MGNVDRLLHCMKYQDGNIPLHCAWNCCKTTLMANLKLLLEADPSSALVAHKTKGYILHWACRVVNVELINTIASVCPEAAKKKDGAGNLALHVALEEGKDRTPVGVVEVLLKAYGGSTLVKDKVRVCGFQSDADIVMNATALWFNRLLCLC